MTEPRPSTETVSLGDVPVGASAGGTPEHGVAFHRPGRVDSAEIVDPRALSDADRPPAVTWTEEP